MADGLFPTKTRLELLQGVDQNLVWRDDRDGQAYFGSGGPGRKPPRITAAVEEMVRAGWIEKRSARSAVYRLTEAGRKVLEEADRDA